MAVSLMDVWNIETFDGNLLAELKANETLVRKYIVTDREIFLERDGIELMCQANAFFLSLHRSLARG